MIGGPRVKALCVKRSVESRIVNRETSFQGESSWYPFSILYSKKFPLSINEFSGSYPLCLPIRILTTAWKREAPVLSPNASCQMKINQFPKLVAVVEEAINQGPSGVWNRSTLLSRFHFLLHLDQFCTVHYHVFVRMMSQAILGSARRLARQLQSSAAALRTRRKSRR